MLLACTPGETGCCLVSWSSLAVLTFASFNCRSSVCYCPQGAGSAGGGDSARHQQQVCSLWQLWQQQQKMFKPQAAVDIQVRTAPIVFQADTTQTSACKSKLQACVMQLPKLMQRVKNRPPEDDFAGEGAAPVSRQLSMLACIDRRQTTKLYDDCRWPS